MTKIALKVKPLNAKRLIAKIKNTHFRMTGNITYVSILTMQI
jgi:hypothetical protein